MRSELFVLISTYSAYQLLKNKKILAKILYIFVSLVTLLFFPNNLRSIVHAALVWNICDLADAFLNMTKYDDDDYTCIHTASTSKSERIEEKVQERSSSEKELKLSFSQPQTVESPLPEDST